MKKKIVRIFNQRGKDERDFGISLARGVDRSCRVVVDGGGKLESVPKYEREIQIPIEILMAYLPITMQFSAPAGNIY